MSDYGPTTKQRRQLTQLIALLRNPEEFGCTIDKGDPANQKRIQEIIEDAAGAVDDMNNREKRNY